jgi:negative regulator of flagellin synthesis FlgM
MRIHPNQVSLNEVAGQPAGKTDKKAPGTGKQVQGEDTASLSSGASRVASLAAKAMEAPEIRQDKVSALRDAIRSGKYSVDSQKVADAMLKEFSEEF